MALTITTDFEMGVGGRQFRFVTVTHDEATSTFAAKTVGLSYIEAMVAGAPYIASTPANLSVYMEHVAVSIVGSTDKADDANNVVSFTLPPKEGSKTKLILVGW